MTEPAQATGQATNGPETTTIQAPVSTPGQSESQQTTNTGPVEAETFFDPKSLDGKPELQLAYKQMQAAYTKKNQDFAKNKHKLDAYDRFEKNPLETLRAIANQYGVELKEAQKQEFQPQTWDDVTKKAREEAKAEVLQELAPYLDQVKEIKKQSIDKQLSEIDPNWRTYEDQMSELLQTHPSLSRDPELLYRTAVPPEVLEQRAMQKALAKINGKTSSTQSSGGSMTPKTPSTQSQGPMNFEQSYAYARQKLAEQGLKPG